MYIRRRARIWLLAGLSWLLSGGAGAWNFNMGPGGGYPPQQPQQPQPPPQADFSFRPSPSNNARGTPPGYPGAGPYGQPQLQPAQQLARLELELSDTRPYLQENILLTLRVISSRNLRTVDPQLPQNEGLVFNLIKGPTAFSRATAGQGQAEIVNELVYLVTPMRVGSLELSRITTQVDQEGGGTYSLTAPQTLRLEVRGADPRVKPWLPLEQLTITSNIDAPMEVQPGKPVSLILKLAATGATGGQLPSMEGLLKSADFRVYREKTDTEGGLSQNGRHIMGSRTEYFTLVPQNGGTLHMPAARIAWFNVTTGTVEHTSLPIKTLEATGEGRSLEQIFAGAISGGPFPTGYAGMFWLPLLGLFLLISGYWLGVWYRGRKQAGPRVRPFPALSAATRALMTRLGQSTGRALDRAWVRPRSYWGRFLVRLARFLPTSLRFWFWVRSLEQESDPEIWSKTLQFMSFRQLSLSPYSTLPQMAERVIRFQPKADPERVRALFRELDGAIYGHQALDFIRWKRDFLFQVRPGIRTGRRPDEQQPSSRLPELNPRGA